MSGSTLPWSARLERAREVLNFAVRRARDVGLARAAGSLTFTTTLALVPLLAVGLALLTAFPLFAEMRTALEKSLLFTWLPGQYGAVILRYLNEFVGMAGRLTIFGLAFLLLTAMMMVLTVDHVVNDIFQVRARRPLVQRLLIYWALLTLGPLVLAASLSASSYLLSVSQGWVKQVPSMLRALLDYTPVVLSGLSLAALYVVVPARKVAWRDALIGGASAAIFGELMKNMMAWYVRGGSVATIYGAFAALPLFLLWIYLSWFAVLFGAAITATLPRLRLTRFADEHRAGNRFVTAVALLRLLLTARIEGRDQGRLGLEELSAAVRTYPEDAEALLLELERLDYVARPDGQLRWVLTCDPTSTTLQALFARLAVDPANSLVRGHEGLQPWMARGQAADWISRPLMSLVDVPAPAVVAQQAA
jgi:membrane protein